MRCSALARHHTAEGDVRTATERRRIAIAERCAARGDRLRA
jgi:hypothetical protein